MADKSKAALVNAPRTIGELKAELAARTAERDALQRDLTDAQNQQTATSQVLQIINSSLGDLTSVFDAMLEKAMHLCEATIGTLWTFDGECFQIVAQHGMPARVRELLSGPLRPHPELGSAAYCGVNTLSSTTTWQGRPYTEPAIQSAAPWSISAERAARLR
jgi:hypothetical protein